MYENLKLFKIIDNEIKKRVRLNSRQSVVILPETWIIDVCIDICVMISSDLSWIVFTGLTLLQDGACAHVYIIITMVTTHAHVPPCDKISHINKNIANGRHRDRPCRYQILPSVYL